MKRSAEQNNGPNKKRTLNIAEMQAQIAAVKQRLTANPLLPKFATASINAKHIKPAIEPSEPQLKIVRPNLREQINTLHYDPVLDLLPRNRKNKKLRFVPQGKYTALAEQKRKEQHLDTLKKQISEAAKMTGVEKELELVGDLEVVIVPEMEWWDKTVLKNGYDAVDESGLHCLIQHPARPKIRQEAAIKIMLTTEERKKARRLRRLQEQKEDQDKIRMGLIDPPPPKVKLSNLMRVLGNDAILDPSKVESQVRQQAEQRKLDHEKRNEDKKLTKEQKRQKAWDKINQDAKKGLLRCVFWIADLKDPQLNFKVNVNAQQLGLTGVCIQSDFCCVIVEGGSKSIKQYKRLLLNRIKWPVEPCSLVWEGDVNERKWRDFQSIQLDQTQVKEVLNDNFTFYELAKDWKRDNKNNL